MHKLGIIYRDLKLENIMLDRDGNIKITDFGLSRLGIRTNNDKAYSFVGTPEYLAPEIVRGGGHSKQADWWSLGSIFYEMITGKSPFYDNNIEKTLDNILFKDIIIPSTVSSKAKNLMLKLLNRDPSKRLGAKNDATELMEDPFFKDIDWSAGRRKAIKPPFKPKILGDAGVRYFSQEFLEEEPVDSMVDSVLTLTQKRENHFEQFTYGQDNLLGQIAEGEDEQNVTKTLKNSIIFEMESTTE